MLDTVKKSILEFLEGEHFDEVVRTFGQAQRGLIPMRALLKRIEASRKKIKQAIEELVQEKKIEWVKDEKSARILRFIENQNPSTEMLKGEVSEDELFLYSYVKKVF